MTSVTLHNMEMSEIRALIEEARPREAAAYVTMNAKRATALVEAVEALADRVDALDTTADARWRQHA